MAQWIETKLRYEKIDERGKQRKVTESYLVDALSFTEAEARIIEEMKPYISGDFTVSAVKKAKIAEVIFDDGDLWYKIRAMFISIDERTGVEKKTPHDFLVEADNLEDAIAIFKSEVHLLTDYEITAVTQTPILEVFPANLSETK